MCKCVSVYTCTAADGSATSIADSLFLKNADWYEYGNTLQHETAILTRHVGPSRAVEKGGCSERDIAGTVVDEVL